jgi:hypothetical protein
MASQMPSEVRVEAVRDDVAYQFPVRPLGKLRLVGVIPAAFGVLFVSVPLRMFLTMLHGIAARNSGANAHSHFQYIFLAFTIPFFVVGSMPIAFGLAILFGRCRVEWREKRLSTVEQVGPFRWRRRLMASKGSVRKLIVSVGPDRSNGTSVTTNLPTNLAALSAEFDSGKPRIVAMGYPREWLQAVAEDLSARVGAVTSVSSRPKIETIYQGRVLDQAGQEMVERPLNATVRLEATANGISMAVPSAGLWKGSKGMLGFSIFWCLFISLFTCVWVASALRKPNSVPWMLWVFLAVFWAAGLGMLTGAVNMGKRRGLVLVSDGRLKVAVSGIFGTKHWDWPREEIGAIRVAGSGMKVNNRPVLELQVHPLAGKKVGLFAGRDEDELRWMAFELRRALGVPDHADGTAAAMPALPMR